MNRRQFARIAGATAFALGGEAFRADAQGGKPNIIFILADDLGYGDLGCFGQERVKTPRLNRMAAEGVRFTDFYAGSTVCAPSRCVLMTGLHTGHCRIRGNARHPLLPQDQTVAELLKQAGYATALIGKWGLGEADSTGIPNRQGFDYFFGYLNQRHAHNYYPAFLWRNQEKVKLDNVVVRPGGREDDLGGAATDRRDYSHDRFTEEALKFIDDNRDGPIFLYLAYTIPHANNESRILNRHGMEVPDYGDYQDEDWPEAQKGTAAMISRMDRDIGRLLDRLGQLGLDDNTIVFFSSDNGPHREGGNDPDFFDSNGPLRGLKRDLYEGGIRVPTIVRWPGQAPVGAVSDHVGSFADFLPTAAELAGVDAPEGLDGISFLPAILGKAEDQKQHDCLYWEFYERGSARAVRMGRWKAVRKPFAGEIELYDLANDIGEQNNVADQHPEVLAQIRVAMDQAHTPSPLWKVPGR
ncbi:MAG: arylsulfatase [Armatimonadota bacterium]